LTAVEPLGYVEFNNLVMNAHAVVTDSGGVQEETTWLNIPCITLRDNTERPVTVTHGTNTLVNVSHDNFPELAMAALAAPKRRTSDIPFWDGRASQRITSIIRQL
jgi:UDP-N-acetylglucosamine 2-epimerase (non-hydrolysing)